ncbi:MAG TPA: DUF2892 domain-containing protein [Lutibacter sp.]|nr:DUF2892 domain-containing protein [Lutibacter sp.]
MYLIMKKNVGSIDKVVRVLIALVAAYFAYKGGFEPAWIAYVLWAVAGVMLFTTLMGSCLLYTAFGTSTCKVKE